jgi:hypothetical protein
MCSFNQSTSFLAEKENSSDSASTSCTADALSSVTHGVDPTCSRGFARIVAMISNQNNTHASKGVNSHNSRIYCIYRDHEIISSISGVAVKFVKSREVVVVEFESDWKCLFMVGSFPGSRL